MSIFIKDSFTDTNRAIINHTPEIGGPWLFFPAFQESGNYCLIRNNMAVGQYFKVCNNTVTPDDCYVQAIFNQGNIAFTQIAGIMARFDIDSRLCIFFGINDINSMDMILSADTDLIIPGAFVNGATYKLVVQGIVVNAYINNILVGTVANTSLPVGYVGMWGKELCAETLLWSMLFDNFEAGDIPTPEPIVIDQVYSWRIFPVDPLYVFRQELRQKNFPATIIEKLITDLKPSEWIPPESH